jgi:hypothetical protein
MIPRLRVDFGVRQLCTATYHLIFDVLDRVCAIFHVCWILLQTRLRARRYSRRDYGFASQLSHDSRSCFCVRGPPSEYRRQGGLLWVLPGPKSDAVFVGGSDLADQFKQDPTVSPTSLGLLRRKSSFKKKVTQAQLQLTADQIAAPVSSPAGELDFGICV